MPSEADKQAIIVQLQSINSDLVRLSTDVKLVSPTNVLDSEYGGRELYQDLDEAHSFLSQCRNEIDQAIDQVGRIELPKEEKDV